MQNFEKKVRKDKAPKMKHNEYMSMINKSKRDAERSRRKIVSQRETLEV